MTPFEFGQHAHMKLAASVGTTPGKGPQKPFNFARAQKWLSKYHPDQITPDMKSSDLYNTTIRLGTIAPGTPQKQITPFQKAMWRDYNGQFPQTPVFATPGKPGYKGPQLQPVQQPQIQQPPVPPQQPAAPPATDIIRRL